MGWSFSPCLSRSPFSRLPLPPHPPLYLSRLIKMLPLSLLSPFPRTENASLAPGLSALAPDQSNPGPDQSDLAPDQSILAPDKSIIVQILRVSGPMLTGRTQEWFSGYGVEEKVRWKRE